MGIIKTLENRVYTTLRASSGRTTSVKAFILKTQRVTENGTTSARAHTYRTTSARVFCLPDAECQGIFLPDDECQGICHPDTECQGIFLPDDKCQGIFLPDDECQGVFLLDDAHHGMCFSDDECQCISPSRRGVSRHLHSGHRGKAYLSTGATAYTSGPRLPGHMLLPVPAVRMRTRQRWAPQ